MSGRFLATGTLALVGPLCQAQSTTVLGLGGRMAGWVAIAVDDAGYADAFVAPTVADAKSVGFEGWGVREKRARN